MIRVVVAEDSPTARRLLVEVLRADPEIQVVGEAKDGVEAVELTRKLRPDLVTMDIQMPNMDGLEATRRIMMEVPTPTVVVSTLVEQDIKTSMNSLRAGALAVLQKLVGPEAPGFEAEARRLRDTIKAMAEVKVVRHWGPRPAPGTVRPERPSPSVVRPELIAIAASTGGPAALHRIISELSASFPVPVLITQHIALGFAEGLCNWLSSSTGRPVKVGRAGEPVHRGTFYVAPDDYHLGITGHGMLEVSKDAPIGGFRPSASYLFRSAGRAYGAGLLALVLTGMGNDGIEGLRVAKQEGSRVVAQDEASSVVWGMPGAVVRAQLADEVLSLDKVIALLKTFDNR